MIIFPSSGVFLQKARATNFPNTLPMTPEGLSDIYSRGLVRCTLEGGYRVVAVVSLAYVTFLVRSSLGI